MSDASMISSNSENKFYLSLCNIFIRRINASNLAHQKQETAHCLPVFLECNLCEGKCFVLSYACLSH